ncbi:MAG: hypothetical protein R2882_06720 [Gemmatimonadales bacterium]
MARTAAVEAEREQPVEGGRRPTLLEVTEDEASRFLAGSLRDQRGDLRRHAAKPFDGAELRSSSAARPPIGRAPSATTTIEKLRPRSRARISRRPCR